MKKIQPSPALVISLIALFVALGGTSYAAITTLPANSVGTTQLKNRAVTAAKLNASALSDYLKYGGALPSGMTEVGDWGSGASYGGGSWPVVSFAVPLATGLDGDHTIYVTGASATHCPDAGRAARGYLCVYQDVNYNAFTPEDTDIFNPESQLRPPGTGTNGFSIIVGPPNTAGWSISGTYAVRAP
jgi:hypothetical protein